MVKQGTLLLRDGEEGGGEAIKIAVDKRDTLLNKKKEFSSCLLPILRAEGPPSLQMTSDLRQLPVRRKRIRLENSPWLYSTLCEKTNITISGKQSKISEYLSSTKSPTSAFTHPTIQTLRMVNGKYALG